MIQSCIHSSGCLYINLMIHPAALKDLQFIVKALKTLSSRWEEIGMTVDVIDLDRIKKEYRGII